MATDEGKTEKKTEKKEKTKEELEAEETRTMEALVNLPRAGLEPQVIKLLLQLPKEVRNNLLSLSDEELAQLGPEELEKVKRAKEQYIEIKKADREVQAMMGEDQVAALVQQKMEEHDLSQEEAELLVKKQLGLLGPKPVTVIQPPAPNPINKLFEDLALEKLKALLFPGGGENKGGQQNADLAKNLQIAQRQGVQSLMLPGGEVINLSPQQDTMGGELTKQALDYIKDKLHLLFEPAGGGGGVVGSLTPEQLAAQNPEILKILLEDKARGAEIEATKVIAQGRNEAITSITSLLGTALTPEGYKKIKDLLKLASMKKGAQDAGETPQDQPPPPVEDKFVSLVCLNTECKHVQLIQRGTPKYTCEKCGTEQEQDWE